MQFELFYLLEDFVEIFEQDVGLLAIEDVMVADDGARLHAKLRLGQDKNCLAFILILVNSRSQFERLLHQADFELIIDLYKSRKGENQIRAKKPWLGR